MSIAVKWYKRVNPVINIDLTATMYAIFEGHFIAIFGNVIDTGKQLINNDIGKIMNKDRYIENSNKS